MKQRVLTQHLRPLRDVELDTLARVTGGESASTSTSGTPSAGDDTIGDCSINNLRQISLAVW